MLSELDAAGLSPSGVDAGGADSPAGAGVSATTDSSVDAAGAFGAGFAADFSFF
jgi:hypothetical protein